MNTRTLPHPRHNSHVIDPRARDDQMLGKGYMPSPSPALPLDGSYYNMNSDRYLSYPPMVRTDNELKFDVGKPVEFFFLEKIHK